MVYGICTSQYVYVHPSVEPKEVHVHEYQQVEVGFFAGCK